MYKLKKYNVLKKNELFQVVYRHGKSYANRQLVLYLLPNQQSANRVGFAAGKRLGGAVVRNRVKRIMREAYRLHQDRLNQGYDMIMVGRQAVVGADYWACARAFLDLCQKAKILQPEKRGEA